MSDIKPNIVGVDMTNAEIFEDIAVSLADAICDGEDTARQKRIRTLLVEFAEEIKRQAVEP